MIHNAEIRNYGNRYQQSAISNGIRAISLSDDPEYADTRTVDSTSTVVDIRSNGGVAVQAIRNQFTADVNTFQGDVRAQRYVVVSDMRAKENITKMNLEDAKAVLLRCSIYQYQYRRTSTEGLGFLAHGIPAKLTNKNPDNGHLAVDYLSMYAHLWVVVQDLVRHQDRQLRYMTLMTLFNFLVFLVGWSLIWNIVQQHT